MDAVHGVGARRLCDAELRAVHFPSVPRQQWRNSSSVARRGFSGHWVLFYSAALATLYAAAVGSEDHS